MNSSVGNHSNIHCTCSSVRLSKNSTHSFQLLCEGLKQRADELARKVEELKEQEEDLMRVVACSSELEATLRAKEDELELSRGVVSENADLQAKVASLAAELDMKTIEVDELKGELSANTDKLAYAERGRAAAISEVAVSEDALCVCKLERTKEMEASVLRTKELEGRIQGLEAELSVLNKQVDSLKAKDVRRQLQPSTSYSPADPVVPRHLYELWVHVEAQLDVYKALYVDGRASEAELRDVRARARVTREACG
ncbi:filament-like plant protein [Nicotiana sylvestris]|uniref:filament-like plant protein n=1 Tax=Nicotiana sylvestris TaxID=4096 RepID=UPI00388C7C6A